MPPLPDSLPTTPPARRVPPLAAVLLAAALLAATAACDAGDDVAAARWQTVTDTVGDTIVVRTVGASDSSALLSLVPELSIGQFDGPDEYRFASVYDVLPAPHGAVDVYDQTLGVLRRYDSTGAFVRRIGGKGGGPGEYDEPNGIVALPDGRLALWDARHQRVNVYDSAGAFATSWRQATNFFSSQGMMLDTAGTLYALHMLEEFDAATPAKERRQGLVHLAVDGTVLDTVALPAQPTPTMLRASKSAPGGFFSTTSRPVPFVPQPTWVFSPLGYFITTPGAPYAVLLERPGAPLRIERAVATVTVPADQRANLEEQITAQMRRMDPAWRWQGPPIPETKPPISHLLADDEGRIWVARSMPSVPAEPDDAAPPPAPGAPPPSRWRSTLAYDVYAPDGHFLGYLPVPRATTLHAMRGDTVWATQRDALDVPTIVRFRISPSIAGARGANGDGDGDGGGGGGAR